MSGYRVAIAQVAARFLDLDGSLDRAEAAVKRAAEAGARPVVFGETWLPGWAGA
jgi:predicted amidohydrolase